MTLENLNPVTWSDRVATPTEPHKPERIAIGEAKLLDPADGAQWAQLRDGRLLRILRERLPMEEENPWRPDRVALVRQERITDERFGMAGGGHRATIVEHLVEAQVVGEADYAAAQARDRAKARRAQAKARRRPATVLRLHPVLHGATSAAAIVATIRRQGFEPVKVADAWELLETGVAGMTTALAAAWWDVRQLVWPYLDSDEQQAPACTAPHKGTAPEAVSIGVAGSLLCAGHASGELELAA